MSLRGEAGRKTYVLLDKLTSGGGDDVFLTHHEIFDGKFVQKTVRMHGLEDALASHEPTFLHQLEHPQIVPVREAQWDPDYEQAITFVMPHMPGGSVDDALVEGYRFSLTESIAIIVDVLDALSYVQREFNAIHRDTKPGNILLDADRSRGYASDFGSAATLAGDGRAEAVLGTNIYRPPESRLTGRIDVASDVYGLGVTLFEMLSGRIAWETMDLAAVEGRLGRGLRAVPDRFLTFDPMVPPRLRRCVRKAIHRYPDQRFQTTNEFITALRGVTTIDWSHVDGAGLEGEWRGTWPPQLATGRRLEYRITSRVLGAGKSRGRLRVEAHARTPGGGWRQAVAAITVSPDDRGALDQFFSDVQDNADHRAPAR